VYQHNAFGILGEDDDDNKANIVATQVAALTYQSQLSNPRLPTQASVKNIGWRSYLLSKMQHMQPSTNSLMA
jgi:hypothetical protein